MPQSDKIAVIGAGPAGCPAALSLKRAGLQPAVLEREAAPGGPTRAVRPDGIVLAEARGAARAFWNGFPEEVEPFELTVRREAIPVHPVGGFRGTAEFQKAMRPRLAFAGDYPTVATVEGAIASGQRAAELFVQKSHE